MNRKHPRGAFAALVLTLLLAIPALGGAAQTESKTTMAEVKAQVADAARAIRDYSAEQSDQALQKVKTALDDLDARIDRMEEDLRTRWDRMDQAAREKANQTLQRLRRQRNTVAEWYGGLKHSSADAWDQMKTGFSQAFEKLKTSWEEAEKEFTSKD